MKCSLLLSGLVIAVAGAMYAEEGVAPQLFKICSQAEGEDRELCVNIASFFSKEALEKDAMAIVNEKEAPSKKSLVEAASALAERHHFSEETKKKEIDSLLQAFAKEALLCAIDKGRGLNN